MRNCTWLVSEGSWFGSHMGISLKVGIVKLWPKSTCWESRYNHCNCNTTASTLFNYIVYFSRTLRRVVYLYIYIRERERERERGKGRWRTPCNAAYSPPLGGKKRFQAEDVISLSCASCSLSHVCLCGHVLQLTEDQIWSIQYLQFGTI